MLKRWLSSFDPPRVDSPPGAVQPFRLLVIRVLQDLLRLAPAGSFASLRRKLAIGELWRTNMLEWRVHRARQMGMKVGERCRLYSLNIASEAELVELGDGVIVSGEVMFVTHDGAVFTALPQFPNVNGHYGRIRVGNDCFLGMRAVLMPGVELGDRCIVAAGAVVMHSFPANSVIAGNPAEYICSTTAYMNLKKRAPGTVYDAEYPFPAKYPPAKLAALLANAPFRTPPAKRAAARPVAPASVAAPPPGAAASPSSAAPAAAPAGASTTS